MSTEYTEQQLQINKTISELEKNQADIAKALSETKLTDKKIKWYEISLLFVLIGVVIAFTKLFL